MRAANISGSRIKETHQLMGWGQVELAAALEVNFEIKLDQSDIFKIERQVRGVKDYELNAVSRLLCMRFEWLLREYAVKA